MADHSNAAVYEGQADLSSCEESREASNESLGVIVHKGKQDFAQQFHQRASSAAPNNADAVLSPHGETPGGLSSYHDDSGLSDFNKLVRRQLRLQCPPQGFRSWMILSYAGAVGRSLPSFFINLDIFGFNYYPFGSENNRFSYATGHTILWFLVSILWWCFVCRPVFEYILGVLAYVFYKFERWSKIHAIILCPIFVFIFLNIDTNIADWFLWITGGLLAKDCCIPLVRFEF